MIASSSNPITRFLTAAALTLLVVAAVAPGKGRAGCGDYVTIDGKSEPMAHQSPARPDRGETSEPAAPKPCHGPNCSQRSSMPLLPLSAPTVAPGDWACLIAQLSDSFRPDQGTVAEDFHFQP